jgi:hypothetical protein
MQIQDYHWPQFRAFQVVRKNGLPQGRRYILFLYSLLYTTKLVEANLILSAALGNLYDAHSFTISYSFSLVYVLGR